MPSIQTVVNSLRFKLLTALDCLSFVPTGTIGVKLPVRGALIIKAVLYKLQVHVTPYMHVASLDSTFEEMVRVRKFACLWWDESHETYYYKCHSTASLPPNISSTGGGVVLPMPPSVLGNP